MVQQNLSEELPGITELSQRVVTATYHRYPKLHRVLSIVLIVLAVTCLVAVVVRLSALPLMPLPFLAFAWYALNRMRAKAEDDRGLLVWTSLFMAGTLVGFWLMSVAARWLEIATS